MSKYHKFVTEPFSAAYPSLDAPDTTSQYPSEMYEVTALLSQDESSTLKSLQTAIQLAAESEFGDIDSDAWNSPLKHLDDGTIKVKFKSKSKPSLQDTQGTMLPTDLKVFGGDLVRVAGSAKGWSMGQKKGVTLYLNSVRLIEKRSQGGDQFGGPEDGYQVGETTEDFEL